MNRINIGRKHSGGIFDGLFGNPVKEKTVSEHYRVYIRRIIAEHPFKAQHIRDCLATGMVLWCPGCGVGAPGCHARILEEELGTNDLFDKSSKNSLTPELE